MKVNEIYKKAKGMSARQICTAEVIHIHGQHIAHTHTEEEYQNHQQPIDNEELLKRRYINE